jgi:hypothetical protein
MCATAATPAPWPGITAQRQMPLTLWRDLVIASLTAD